MPSETVQNVIDAITENRCKFEAFCHALSEEQLARAVPGSTWIVRDFAAHLGTLDTALLNWFGAVPAGAAADSSVGADGQPFDVDEFNNAQAASRRLDARTHLRRGGGESAPTRSPAHIADR